MDSLLDVRNLSIRYCTEDGASVHAVDDANFRIAAGEIVGVLGESGSGKSTLAASLLALFPGNAVGNGAVLLRGTNILSLNRKELEDLRGNRISIIFQEPSLSLHPTMRAGTQIEEVLRAHSQNTKEARRSEVERLLNLIFEEDADRVDRSYPHQLSGGQRQRVAIAQAIVCKPSLLIADEPTASLDPVTQSEILRLLRKLQSELGLAILFITHTPELLSEFADRILVMYAGKIVETGSAAELLHSPLHPYTQALLSCRPKMNLAEEFARYNRLPVVPGEMPDLAVRASGCSFEPRCSERIPICREQTPGVTTINENAQVRCLKFHAESGN